MKNKLHVSLSLLLLSLLALPAIGGAQAPVVRKVEPPNWWAGFTPELTLLLTGENLSGARVESETQNLDVMSTENSSNGHYLFVRLKLDSSLAPGTVKLSLRTATGATSIELPLQARGTTQKYAEGLSCDDVIYLIMPDRFADGDVGNDQPTGSSGVYDRRRPMAYHGGDLRGVRDHLGYLHGLGVTTIWLTPVWKNTDSDYHGLPCSRFLCARRSHGNDAGLPVPGGRSARARYEGSD